MPEMSLAHVLAALDLRRMSPDTFSAPSQPLPPHRVFGGQLLAQSVIAAGHTVRDNSTIHSLHAYFVRTGDPAEPIEFTVDRTRDGRSFAARRVEAVQYGKTIFQLLASFQEPASGPSHQDSLPAVPGPDSLPARFPFGSPDGPIEARRVPQGAEGRSDGRARAAVWVRLTGALPPNPLLHTALLAYLSDYSIMHAALRTHSLRHSSQHVKTASLDHAMWFHGPANLEGWLLYDTVSPAAGSARALGMGRLFTRSGQLLATVGQEAMVRISDTP
ncbi:acyl-CoA thioesterase-2 [Saccharomonospora amisosensis]|uniref:Acyl-CoA thioesterase-2 n=1 Tax=Saccharomonospora amisosensis TaxID=1128677 RepID=A0A7X5ZR04_9PSEU|nr:acyl-CoA thioesterase II [Saccharomonospora amisosensis]NIJ12383.1 acyl-CoA thioesterase-2 [Saccharomonospora amisosensis]